MKRRNEIVESSYKFAITIIEYSEILEANKKFVIAKQLLRSGTSVGANIKEAQSAESKADFIHKLKIANKEAVESEYWLELCSESKNYPSPPLQVNEYLTSILKLLNKIISTSKKSKYY